MLPASALTDTNDVGTPDYDHLVRTRNFDPATTPPMKPVKLSADARRRSERRARKLQDDIFAKLALDEQASLYAATPLEWDPNNEPGEFDDLTPPGTALHEVALAVVAAEAMAA